MPKLLGHNEISRENARGVKRTTWVKREKELRESEIERKRVRLEKRRKEREIEGRKEKK